MWGTQTPQSKVTRYNERAQYIPDVSYRMFCNGVFFFSSHVNGLRTESSTSVEDSRFRSVLEYFGG